MDDFSLALHRELTPEGNLVWSPYSVASALGLAAAGARGATRDELARALAPDGTLEDLGRALDRSAVLRDAEIAVANTLWAREGLRFRDEYQRTVLGWPGGALHNADFAGDPEGARRAINADVAKTTHDLVRELLAAGTIDPGMAAVIVNALYLKVAWRVPFDESGTEPRPFHAPSGPRPVPTMRQVESLPYAELDGWRMVTLPTASEVVVDVLLPGEGPPPLRRLRATARRERVDLALPSFRVEAEVQLTEPLGRLGVHTAFDPDTADFSGIAEAEVHLDRVVHKAVLRVDEQGFEGAAATAVLMRMASFQVSRPIEFHVDRPFLCVVRHPETGAGYFLARVTEP